MAPRHLFDGHWIVLPPRVDLNTFAPPVGDQGYVGSCAAWAATYTLVGWYINEERLPGGYMAPAYTYHQISWGHDQGSAIGAALDVDTHGMVPMRLYPQGNYDWQTSPTGAQMALARHWRVAHPQVLYQPWSNEPADAAVSVPPATREDQMNHARYLIEHALALGHPGLVELRVSNGLYTATPQTAWISPTAPHEAMRGWHALVALGYDSAGLWVENSWGTGWGLNGYAELSWDYVMDNLRLFEAIDGVRMTRGVVLPAPAAGPPTVTATIVKGGHPQHGPTVLRDGEEVVWTGRGFRPGETVYLSWDGLYRVYVTALPDGTWSLEWYDHQHAPASGHNLRPLPGLHRFSAVGNRGDHAWCRLAVR